MTIRIQRDVGFALEMTEIVIREPAITQWQRLEPEPSTPDLAPGIEARIADPLWMVGRQWQLAELKGEDAGTPVRVQLEGEAAPIGFAADDPRAAHALGDRAGLIEPLVEAEDATAARASLAVEAGADFVRALHLHGVGDLVGTFVAQFAFVAPPGVDPVRDRDGARLLALCDGTAIDGARLADGLDPQRAADGSIAQLPASLSVPAGRLPAVLAAATDWMRAWESLCLAPVGAPAWRDARLEYAFAVEARQASAARELVATEYHGGRLDWWSFDLGAPSTPSQPFAGTTRRAVMLPSPIRYPGMPADRYWEFEDGAVNLAMPKGGPAAVALMLVLEYELVGSNDWFQVPLELEYGSAFRVTTLDVTDTFGRTARIGPAPAGVSGWGLFELTPLPSAGASPPPLFILPQVTADVLESDPLEEIRIFRDEMANLVWAVEKRVAGFAGTGVDPSRRGDGRVALSQQPHEYGEVDAAALYRLQSTAPESWFPFVAEPEPNGPPGSVVLARRSLRRVLVSRDGVVTEEVASPAGAFLHGSQARFAVEEREVPRSGLALTRTFQHARTADGRRVVWLGRHKRVGRGEGASDLRYDQLDPLP